MKPLLLIRPNQVNILLLPDWWASIGVNTYTGKSQPVKNVPRRSPLSITETIEHLRSLTWLIPTTETGVVSAREGPMRRNSGSRSFTVGRGMPWLATLGKADVRFIAGKVFEKLLARFAVLCRARRGAAGDIHVHSPADLAGNEDADLICDGPILGRLRACQSHQAIRVAHGDFTFPACARSDLAGIVALGRTSPLVDDAFEPGLGILHFKRLEHRSEPRQFIERAIPKRSGLVLILGAGQFLLRIDLVELTPPLHRRSGASRSASSMTTRLLRIFQFDGGT